MCQFDEPAPRSLARIFREIGVARVGPRKKPRAAYRRVVYPARNACWQLDATEYALAGGRKCVIFQLIDDHSRYAVASHAATGETSRDAIREAEQAVLDNAGTLIVEHLWPSPGVKYVGNAPTCALLSKRD
jgi:transposase InsO family protein